MGIKQWNRGQLLVFFGAILLAEGVVAWKYYNVEAEYDSNAKALTLAAQYIQTQQAAGNPPEDSLVKLVVRGIQQTTIDGPKVHQTQQLMLLLGGLLIPAAALSVAWVWFSGKPRAG